MDDEREREKEDPEKWNKDKTKVLDKDKPN